MSMCLLGCGWLGSVYVLLSMYMCVCVFVFEEQREN